MRMSTDSTFITRKQRSDKLPESYKVRSRRQYPFIGWDGEGYGNHHYGLFGNSLGSMVQGTSLTYADCLPLLMDSPKQAIHVIYAGTYDVTMMFRGTPQIQAILNGQWCSVGRYRLRFLRGKSLNVKDTYTGESRTLYDVFSFFGSSFVKACREYLTDDQLHSLDVIAGMKDQRSSFTSITPEIREYMRGELVLLVQLATTLRERLAAVDIYPTRWHGPGAVASTVLKQQGIKAYLGEQTQDLTLAAESAYYGGRFEMFKRGTHYGPAYQYDIRSAYPHAMTRLPALDGVTWSRRDGGKVTEDFALYRVNRRHVEQWQTVPHRTRWGAIYFPEFVNGWYWGVELPHGMPCVERWTPDNIMHYPFRFVSEMYDNRARLKQQGKPEQLALKLALNSLYGKVAQSKGANWNGRRWQKPTYHQPMWAGYITAYTRALIQQAMHLAGDDLIAVETDAVFTTKPLDLILGTQLGSWEETVYDGIKYIQSGVHMMLSDGEWSYKSRGLTMKGGQTDIELWDNLLSTGHARINQTRFGTDPRQEGFGTWYVQERHLRLDHPQNMEKRIARNPCELCKKPPKRKLNRSRTSRQQLPGNQLDYDTHLHPMYVPELPHEPSVPYRFVWNLQHVTVDDDPTLFLEYVPDHLT